MSFAYEALDRTHCIIMQIQTNLIEHKFYDSCEDYKSLVDQACNLLAEAYQVAGREWDTEESGGNSL